MRGHFEARKREGKRNEWRGKERKEEDGRTPLK